MILSATGHRPDKLVPTNPQAGCSSATLELLTDLAVTHLELLDPELVISGMAQGWDTAVALAAIELDIPLVTAEPFLGQAAKWPTPAQQLHARILGEARVRYVISDGHYAPWKFQKRNEWMVDRCDRLLALWNGTPGGTANCMAYADKQQKPYDNLWAEWTA